MKIVFTSDLHGNSNKYDTLYDVARKHGADVVINGGDEVPVQAS